MKHQILIMKYKEFIIKSYFGKYKVIAPNGDEWLEDTIEEAKLVIDAEVE